MAAQAMLRAVNRDLRALPADVGRSALAELVRELARRFDAGDMKVAGELRRTLAELLRPSRSKPVVQETAGQEVADVDDLDAIKAERAVRRDELARRRSRRAGSAVHDGAESRPGAGGDGSR